jgi:endonuclease-3
LRARKSPVRAVTPAEAASKPSGRSKTRLASKTRPGGRKTADPARVAEIFRRFEAADPHPKGELDYTNAFTLLVAVVLSAQATDKGVNKATAALFAAADSAPKMLALGEEKVREFVKAIGLFRTKARHVIALSRQLIDKFGGDVPASREALEALPGVGRKTANVVMNIAFGAPTIAVDTHIVRGSNRIPRARGKTPLEVETGLETLGPKAFRPHAHHWLILHGRYVCKARRPECERCVIADLCESPEKRI